jgi:hypothetical protein
LLYGQLGYYISGRISQYQLKLAVKERIWNEAPDSCFEAVVLSGNEKNISWEEKGKEFSYKGLMYDVAKTKTINGKTILFCVNDKMEDQLLQQINDITRTNQQHNGHHAIQVSTVLYDIFFPQPVSCLSFDLPCRPVGIYYTVALPNQPVAILVPPPRCLA